jgi:hypothetical protein
LQVKQNDVILQSTKKNTSLNFEPKPSIVNSFQNVSKADLKMLYPNERVRMWFIDKAVTGT